MHISFSALEEDIMKKQIEIGTLLCYARPGWPAGTSYGIVLTIPLTSNKQEYIEVYWFHELIGTVRYDRTNHGLDCWICE